MNIEIYTNDPNGLSQLIIESIENGELQTWETFNHKEVDYIRHDTNNGQWRDIVLYLEPKDRIIVVSTRRIENTNPSRADYSTVIGRFVGALLSHFHDSFDRLVVNK